MTPKKRPERISYNGGAKESMDRGNYDFWFSDNIEEWCGRRRKTMERILREKQNENR